MSNRKVTKLLAFLLTNIVITSGGYADSADDAFKFVGIIDTLAEDKHDIQNLINQSPGARGPILADYALSSLKGNWSTWYMMNINHNYKEFTEGAGLEEFELNSEGLGDYVGRGNQIAGLVHDGLNLLGIILNKYAPCSIYGTATSTPILIQNNTSKDIAITYNNIGGQLSKGATYPGFLSGTAQCTGSYSGVEDGTIYIKSGRTAVSFIQAGGSVAEAPFAGAPEKHVPICANSDVGDPISIPECRMSFNLEGSNDAPISLTLVNSVHSAEINKSSFEYFGVNIDSIKNNEHFVLAPCSITGNLDGDLGTVVANDITAADSAQNYTQMAGYDYSNTDGTVKFKQNQAICMAIYPKYVGKYADESGIVDYEEPKFWSNFINGGLFAAGGTMPVYFNEGGSNPFYETSNYKQVTANVPMLPQSATIDMLKDVASKDKKYFPKVNIFADVTHVGTLGLFYSDIQELYNKGTSPYYPNFQGAISIRQEDLQYLNNKFSNTQIPSKYFYGNSYYFNTKVDTSILLRVFYNASNPPELPFSVDIMVPIDEHINTASDNPSFTYVPLRWLSGKGWVLESEVSKEDWIKAQPVSQYGQIYAVTDPAAYGNTYVGESNNVEGMTPLPYRFSGGYGMTVDSGNGDSSPLTYQVEKGVVVGYLPGLNYNFAFAPSGYSYKFNQYVGSPKMDLTSMFGTTNIDSQRNEVGSSIAFIYRDEMGHTQMFSNFYSKPYPQLIHEASGSYSSTKMKSNIGQGWFYGYNGNVGKIAYDYMNTNSRSILTVTSGDMRQSRAAVLLTDLYESLGINDNRENCGSLRTLENSHGKCLLDEPISYGFNEDLNERFITGVPIAKRQEEGSGGIAFLPRGSVYVPDPVAFSAVPQTSESSTGNLRFIEMSLSEFDHTVPVKSVVDHSSDTIKFEYAGSNEDAEKILNGNQDVWFSIVGDGIRHCQFIYNHRGSLVYGDEAGGWGINSTFMKPDVTKNKLLAEILCKSKDGHSVNPGVYSADLKAAYNYGGESYGISSPALLSVGEDDNKTLATPDFNVNADVAYGNDYRLQVNSSQGHSVIDYPTVATIQLLGVNASNVGDCTVYASPKTGSNWINLGKAATGTFLLSDTTQFGGWLTNNGTHAISVNCMYQNREIDFSKLSTLVQIGSKEEEAVYQSTADESDSTNTGTPDFNVQTYNVGADYRIYVGRTNGVDLSQYPSTSSFTIEGVDRAKANNCTIYYNPGSSWNWISLGNAKDGRYYILDDTRSVGNWLTSDSENGWNHAISINCWGDTSIKFDELTLNVDIGGKVVKSQYLGSR